MKLTKMNKENIKTPTEHVSFRINQKFLNHLKDIAKEEKVSLNTYVNQIFDSHLSWDLYAPELGWVVMLKSAMQELIKNVDKETIREIAKNTAEAGSKEIALSMRGSYDIKSWKSILKDRAKSSGFSIKEYTKNGKTRLVLHHDMGESWSVFFETYYHTVFFELGSQVTTEHTENSILVDLKEEI